MKTGFKATIVVTMSAALICGFLHLFLGSLLNLERLHVFLFNLVSGGAVLLYYSIITSNNTSIGGGSRNWLHRNVVVYVALYYLLSLGYAFSAFWGSYFVTLVFTVPLVLIVESVRVSRFSFFPLDFFSSKVPVSKKFHHAALLCLSMALVSAALVIANNHYFKWITLEKLQLDVFFLGYSFPVSLVTMSVLFELMEVYGKNKQAGSVGKPMLLRWRFSNEYLFWSINGGVIVFFLFILLGWTKVEMMMGLFLLLNVILMFYLYIKATHRIQSRNLLVSGMLILVGTGVTGVLYIMRYYWPASQVFYREILSYHGFISIYGWNLIGMLMMARCNDFPLKINHRYFIAFHWAVLFVLVPLGKHHVVMAVIAVVSYVALLIIAFFSKKETASAMLVKE